MQKAGRGEWNCVKTKGLRWSNLQTASSPDRTMLFERLQNSRSNTELSQGCDFSFDWRAETITKAGHVVFCSRFRINL